MLEPAHDETYDLSTSLNPVVVGTEFDCGIDETLYSCFFLDGDNISGKTPNDPTNPTYYTDTGIETIKDDVIKPYAMKQDGTMTYVRCQKTEVKNAQNVLALSTWNCGLYVAGKLIEESGFLPVITLYDDTVIPTQYPPGYGYNLNKYEYGGCPIYIRQVNYRILHAHHDANFDVCIYRKTVYQSNENVLLPYYYVREAWDSIEGRYYYADYQLRQTTIDSITTYWIVVNGKVSQIMNGNTPYQSVNHENQMTVTGTPLETSGSTSLPITPAPAGMQEVDDQYFQGQLGPWVNIDTGSVNITRIFTTASSKHILIGFDVFPVQVNHIRTYFTQDGDNNLVEQYDTSVNPFPPASDGTYPSVQDRKWILFDVSGNGSQIQTPTVNNDGKTKVNRVNGLCLLET